MKLSNNIFDYLFNFNEVSLLLAWESLLLVGIALLLLWVSKLSIGWFGWFKKDFQLDHELLENDNPALAVAVAGYFLAVGIILYYVMDSPAHPSWEGVHPYWYPLIDVVYWFILSVVLLNLARIINDKFILGTFNNEKEIIIDRNVGTGAVLAGSYIASAFMIGVVVSYGNEGGLLLETGLVFVYFMLLQLGLIVFSKIYARLLPYDLHAVIEADNPAPGISFGAALIAMGMISSYPLRTTGNLWVTLFWFVNAIVLLLFARLVLNFSLFKKANVDEELARDRNWGLAIIEAVVMLVTAFIIKASF